MATRFQPTFCAKWVFTSALLMLTFLIDLPGNGTATARGAGQPQRGVPRRSDPKAQPPYPGSLRPTEVLANIRAIVQRLHIDEDLKIPELAMRNNELRVRRILRVRSDKAPPQYVLVELEDLSANLVASIALTPAGEFMGAEDCRRCLPPNRPLDLSDASRRVQNRRGRAPQAAEYVYFNNMAEPGYSRFRPLVAVSTERGAVYLNARGEAFVEEGSPLLEEFGKSTAVQAPASMQRLRGLGGW